MKKRLRILIYNPVDFRAMEALQTFSLQTNVIEQALKNLEAEAISCLKPDEEKLAAASVVTAAAIISSGLQLLSLFRVDHKLKSFKIEVRDQVLAVAVAGALREQGFSVYNTAVVPIVPRRKLEFQIVVPRLMELAGLRTKLVEVGDRLLSAGGNTKGADSDGSKALRRSLHDRIVAAITALDVFEDGLAKVDEKTGLSPMSQLVAAENLLAFLDDGQTRILWLNAVGAGGGSHAKESTFRSDLIYSGGAIASYALYDGSGELLEANMIPVYAGYVRMSQLEEGELRRFKKQDV